MIQVGLVGYGLAGRAFHAPVISRVKGLQLAAIVQRTGDQAGQAYPHARIVRSFDELLTISGLRLIVVASPNHTHYEFARRALESGRDVLVDKPFTPTLPDAVQLVQLAKDTGRLITVYQNRRYDGDFAAIRKIVAEGTLGRIVTFETHYDRYRPALKHGVWREQVGAGNGLWFDIGPHLVDHALMLFGEPEADCAPHSAPRFLPPPRARDSCCRERKGRLSNRRSIPRNWGSGLDAFPPEVPGAGNPKKIGVCLPPPMATVLSGKAFRGNAAIIVISTKIFAMPCAAGRNWR